MRGGRSCAAASKMGSAGLLGALLLSPIEPVPESADGHNISRTGRIRFHFAPQPGDHLRDTIVRYAATQLWPDLRCDLLMTDHSTCSPEQKGEQPILFGGERHQLALDSDFVCGWIQRESARVGCQDDGDRWWTRLKLELGIGQFQSIDVGDGCRCRNRALFIRVPFLLPRSWTRKWSPSQVSSA